MELNKNHKLVALKEYGLSERFINESNEYPDLILARIIGQYRGEYKIISEYGKMQAKISGKLRYDTKELAKFPTIGDFVMVSTNEASNSNNISIIHHVLTRKSVFMRSAVGLKEQAQSIASNIDIVFICMSLNNNFNLNRLERYLGIAWDSGATPVILLTKSDLLENNELEKAIREVEEVSAFSDVIAVSSFNNSNNNNSNSNSNSNNNIVNDDINNANGVNKLAKYIKNGTTSAFIGSSGVGKSTLINNLLELNQELDNLATGEIDKADKGKHTTTNKEMFICKFGGVLIDTPGMRELGVENADLNKTFDDIEELANLCRFSDCTHTSEPNCAILKALEDGEITQRRLDNYNKIKNEAGYDGLNAKQIEVKKLERMFKDVGGMKNKRKFLKEQYGNKK